MIRPIAKTHMHGICVAFTKPSVSKFHQSKYPEELRVRTTNVVELLGS